MKKLFFIIVLCLLFAACVITYSQNYTITWDAVNMTGEISYEVFLKNIGTLEVIRLGETYELEYTIALYDEGVYLVGVRTVRLLDWWEEPQHSATTWSDDPDTEYVPIPFVLEFYAEIPAPKNLRLK